MGSHANKSKYKYTLQCEGHDTDLTDTNTNSYQKMLIYGTQMYLFISVSVCLQLYLDSIHFP